MNSILTDITAPKDCIAELDWGSTNALMLQELRRDVTIFSLRGCGKVRAYLENGKDILLAGQERGVVLFMERPRRGKKTTQQNTSPLTIVVPDSRLFLLSACLVMGKRLTVAPDIEEAVITSMGGGFADFQNIDTLNFTTTNGKTDIRFHLAENLIVDATGKQTACSLSFDTVGTANITAKDKATILTIGTVDILKGKQDPLMRGIYHQGPITTYAHVTPKETLVRLPENVSKQLTIHWPTPQQKS